MQPLTHQVVLTEFDRNRLQNLLRVLRARSGVNAWNLDALELELKRAEVVPAERVPGDVITMNSRVTLREQSTNARLTVTLVFPETIAGEENRVPVLSPFGLALLGCRAGHVLEWQTESGPRRLLVEQIEYQPEASGNFYL